MYTKTYRKIGATMFVILTVIIKTLVIKSLVIIVMRGDSSHNSHKGDTSHKRRKS